MISESDAVIVGVIANLNKKTQGIGILFFRGWVYVKNAGSSINLSIQHIDTCCEGVKSQTEI